MSSLARRLLATIPVILGVATIAFFILHLVPGDPVDLMLGEQASTADKSQLRRELGLDQPITTQYAHFLGGVVKFDLGRSLNSRRPVAQEVFERLPATLELSMSAMLIAILAGVPLGVWSSLRKNKISDQLLRLVSLVGISTPSFWLGPMFVLIFAIKLDWLPVSERGGIEHLILPALTLACGLTCVLIQVTRASMLEVIRSDYITTAKAKGAAPFRLWFKHALKNALIPVISVVGLQFGAVLTGTVIIETIFDWPGLGTLLFQAIQQRNYPLVQGCVLVIALIYVLVNLLTDLAYTLVQPNMRVS